MFSTILFWPWFIGLVFLVTGLIMIRGDLLRSKWLDKFVEMGPVFFAAPLAAFGTEHLVSARFIMQAVPAWMPFHLFWAYFVGVALICAAVSIVLKRYVRLSATLLGAMLFLFVAMLQIPRVLANPTDRFSWAVALRDLAFGAAAFALAGRQDRQWSASGSFIAIGRYCIAISVLFFGVEHGLHPKFLPGVPLEKVTPPWVPLPAIWGYLTGVALLSTGIALLVKKSGRIIAASTGTFIALLVVFIYLPLLPLASKGSEINEATNYIADTLFFAGAILVLAGALPDELPVAEGPKDRQRFADL